MLSRTLPAKSSMSCGRYPTWCEPWESCQTAISAPSRRTLPAVGTQVPATLLLIRVPDQQHLELTEEIAGAEGLDQQRFRIL